MAGRYKAKIRPGTGGVPKGTVPWNKGLKRKITWGDNISKALKGRKITWADKIGAANKGRVITKEHRQKISETRKNREIPAWNIGKRKCDHPEFNWHDNAGEKHWNWKGGISSDSVRLRQSSRYKRWRDKVFRRDNWTCKKCGKHGGYLEAHHKKLFSTDQELRFLVKNGETLCRPCHRAQHRKLRVK